MPDNQAEEIEIVLEDEQKPGDGDGKTGAEVKVDAPREEPPKVVTADEGIEELKRRLAASDARAATAERQRDEATATARTALSEKTDTELSLVTNAIELVKQSNESLKGKLREARETGDVDAEADILAQIGANGVQLHTLERGKVQLEEAAKAPKPDPVREISDPVEALAVQLTPRSAAWVRSHPEYARDTRLYQRMLAAHNLAVTDGIDVDTDDYFAAVEKTLGIGNTAAAPAEDESALSGASQGQKRQSAAPPAAPPSRSGTLNGSRPDVITLTAEEREIARANGMTDKEYALAKRDLIREGRMH